MATTLGKIDPAPAAAAAAAAAAATSPVVPTAPAAAPSQATPATTALAIRIPLPGMTPATGLPKPLKDRVDPPPAAAAAAAGLVASASDPAPAASSIVPAVTPPAAPAPAGTPAPAGSELSSTIAARFFNSIRTVLGGATSPPSAPAATPPATSASAAAPARAAGSPDSTSSSSAASDKAIDDSVAGFNANANRGIEALFPNPKQPDSASAPTHVVSLPPSTSAAAAAMGPVPSSLAGAIDSSSPIPVTVHAAPSRLAPAAAAPSSSQTNGSLAVTATVASASLAHSTGPQPAKLSLEVEGSSPDPGELNDQDTDELVPLNNRKEKSDGSASPRASGSPKEDVAYGPLGLPPQAKIAELPLPPASPKPAASSLMTGLGDGKRGNPTATVELETQDEVIGSAPSLAPASSSAPGSASAVVTAAPVQNPSSAAAAASRPTASALLDGGSKTTETGTVEGRVHSLAPASYADPLPTRGALDTSSQVRERIVMQFTPTKQQEKGIWERLGSILNTWFWDSFIGKLTIVQVFHHFFGASEAQKKKNNKL